MTSGAQDRPASAEILCTATQAHFRRKARDVAKFARCGRASQVKEKMQQNITNCQFSRTAAHVLQGPPSFHQEIRVQPKLQIIMNHRVFCSAAENHDIISHFHTVSSRFGSDVYLMDFCYYHVMLNDFLKLTKINQKMSIW